MFIGLFQKNKEVNIMERDFFSNQTTNLITQNLMEINSTQKELLRVEKDILKQLQDNKH